jgi:uncharacterized protein (DUF58 family)
MERITSLDGIPFSGTGIQPRWYLLGAALLILGIPFRQPLLVVVGLLCLLVVILVDLGARYCLRNVEYKRQLSEQRVLFGEEITLTLTVENAKLLPLPWLESADAISPALKLRGQTLHRDVASGQLLLESLFSPTWYDRVTRRYTIECRERGVHGLGPTRLRSGDIFGFVTREMSIPNQQYVLVYPLVVPITSFGLPARHPFGDRRAPRRLLEDPARIVGVRDYAYGDSLRRVHWKASARAMKLQSKVYEETTTYTLNLFLNMSARLDAHYGIHPELLELSICAAASIASWACDEGYAVGLYSNSMLYIPDEESHMDRTLDEQGQPIQSGEEEIRAMLRRRRVHIPAASNPEQKMRILEALARLQSYFGSTIEDTLQAERARLAAGSSVVLITTSISETLIEPLYRLRQNGHPVTILFVGDTLSPVRLSGITVYHIGGEATWAALKSGQSSVSDQSARTTPVATGFAL